MYKNRTRLYRLDALEFTHRLASEVGANAFMFFGPSYIERGEDLYLNDYTIEDHWRLAEAVDDLAIPKLPELIQPPTRNRAEIRRIPGAGVSHLREVAESVPPPNSASGPPE